MHGPMNIKYIMLFVLSSVYLHWCK